MSVTSFLHLSETVGEFDLKTFCEEIQKKYPGTDTEQSQSKSLAYDITWSRYADFPKEQEVVLVDENNEAPLPLSSEAATEDIEAWILRVGI